MDIIWFLGILFKLTKVIIKSYQDFYWTIKMAQNGPKQHNKLFFCLKGKKSLCLGRSSPQELEVGPRSGPYLLFLLKTKVVLILVMFIPRILMPKRVEHVPHML